MIRKHAQDAVLAVFETGRSQLGFVANSPPMAACIGAHAKAAPGTAPNKTGANGADRLFWSAASLRPRIFHCKTSNADRAAERTVNPGGCLLREEGHPNNTKRLLTKASRSGNQNVSRATFWDD
jgi:hypothetical protein